MTIHHRKTLLDEEDPSAGIQHWVSLDGKVWLPVNRAPSEDTTEAEIQAVFDGDGKMRPMRFHRRYVERLTQVA